MKTKYEITFDAIAPVIGRINVEADNEYEIALIAQRIAESQSEAVKGILDLESFPTHWLTIQAIFEMTPIDPLDTSGKVWKREEIKRLLNKDHV